MIIPYHPCIKNLFATLGMQEASQLLLQQGTHHIISSSPNQNFTISELPFGGKAVVTLLVLPENITHHPYPCNPHRLL